MQMTRQELVERARTEYLDDTLEPYLWSAEKLNLWARQAEYEACRRMDRAIFDDTTSAICTVTCTAAAPTQDLHGSIIDVDSVRYVTSDTTYVLTQKAVHELDRDNPTWRTTSGDYPTEFVIRGRTIRPVPIPDTGESFELSLDVYRYPNGGMTTDASEPELSYEYHDDLVHWICHRAFMQRDAETYQPDKAAEHYALFENTYGSLEDARVRRHELESPKPVIVRPTSYYGPSDGRRDDSWTNW